MTAAESAQDGVPLVLSDEELLATSVGLGSTEWPGLLPTYAPSTTDLESVVARGLRSIRVRHYEGRIDRASLEIVEVACRADAVVNAICTDEATRVNPASNGVTILRSGNRIILDRFDRTGVHVLDWLPNDLVESVLRELLVQSQEYEGDLFACLWESLTPASPVFLSQKGQALQRPRAPGGQLAPATDSTIEDCVCWLGGTLRLPTDYRG